jgi:3-deoxy-7-phosphoheptulonate synthase
MMIVMKPEATEQEVRAVIERVESVGARTHVSAGEEVTVIGAIGDREHVARLELEGAPGVDRVVPILKPYKLASAQFKHGERSVLDIAGRKVGGNHFAMIAGPCTVESREQTLDTARIVGDAGATLFRGGAYKPRTSPYAFQGLGQEGLRLLAEAKAETGMPVVTEVMDVRDLDAVLEVADVLQIGARNMQNYTLLSEVGRSGRPALLKRGLSSTLEELLMAAEYVRAGDPDVRDRVPVHARPDGGAGAQGAQPPPRDRRSEPRRRASRPGHAALAGRRGRRRRRDHRRGPSPARGGDLRRTPAARRG